MMNKLLLLTTLLLLVQTYDIVVRSGGQGCTSDCKQCLKQQGGPFNVNRCIDPFTFGPELITQTFTIKCGGCSGDCSYATSINNKTVSGCTNDTDPLWPILKGQLDNDYKSYVSAIGTYYWCGNAVCGLSTGAIIAIATGGAALLVIGIIFAVKFYKSKKLETYQKV